jgi:hypothetical protein
MKSHQLDHVLRAAGDATGQKRFVLVGSTAVVAWRVMAPPEMTISREADLFAWDVSPEEAVRIADDLDSLLGQQSQFDATHGYYVDGVEPSTATLPSDWRERSMTYSSPATGGVEALVPHPEDIALSKLCAGREKDIDWVAAGIRAGLINPKQLMARIDRLPGLSDEQKRHVQNGIAAATNKDGRPWSLPGYDKN